MDTRTSRCGRRRLPQPQPVAPERRLNAPVCRRLGRMAEGPPPPAGCPGRVAEGASSGRCSATSQLRARAARQTHLLSLKFLEAENSHFSVRPRTLSTPPRPRKTGHEDGPPPRSPTRPGPRCPARTTRSRSWVLGRLTRGRVARHTAPTRQGPERIRAGGEKGSRRSTRLPRPESRASVENDLRGAEAGARPFFDLPSFVVSRPRFT